jgi:hypothetical protein
MAKKIAPFKSSVTERGEAKDAAKRSANKGGLKKMIDENNQPIKLKKPFKRYMTITKSPIAPNKRKGY